MVKDEMPKWDMDLEIKKISEDETKKETKTIVRFKGADAKTNLEIALTLKGDCNAVKNLLSEMRAVKAGDLVTVYLGNKQTVLEQFGKKKE